MTERLLFTFDNFKLCYFAFLILLNISIELLFLSLAVLCNKSKSLLKMSSDVEIEKDSFFMNNNNTQHSKTSESFLNSKDEYAKNHVDAISRKISVSTELRTAYNDMYVMYDDNESIREIFLF